MLILLSPAKTLDTTPIQSTKYTEPRLLTASQQLVDVLQQKTASELKQLMKVSDKIANLNVERFGAYQTPFTPTNAKIAGLTFKGDVYLGLDASSFDTADFAFAQQHLRILSGLYGILRPLDLMQPYRLEMGTRLRKNGTKNLYEFWDNQITDLLNEDLASSQSEVVLNLASKEYFKSVRPKLLDKPICTIDFKENRGGKYKIIAFNAKKARGAMARQLIQQRITKLEAIKKLEVNTYQYNPELSTDLNYVFTID